MSRVQAWTWLWVTVFLCGVAGCAAGPNASAPSPAKPAPQVSPANLNGNWLLAGSLPETVGLLGPPEPFGLAVTLTTQGNAIVGSGVLTYDCNGTSSGLGFVQMTGTIAKDGTFTASASAPNGLSLQYTIALSGSVPMAQGEGFPGSYSLQLGPAEHGSTCVFEQNSAFTASALPTVTGTYIGTGTMGTGAAANTVKLTLQLQQGVNVTTANGATVDALELGGSVQVEGSPCFSRGMIPLTSLQPARLGIGDGHVAGDEVSALFSMDDGSRLSLSGDFADAQGSRLVLPFVSVVGGSCGSATPEVIRVKELDHVS